MNLLNFFRKPYFSVLTLLAFLAFSCTPEDIVIDNDSLTAEELKAIHSDIKDSQQSMVTLNGRISSDFNWEEISPDFEANLEYVNQNGIEALFSLHGIDTEIIKQLETFNENADSEQVYEILAQNFEICSAQEALTLFELIEVNSIVIDQFENQNGRVAGHWGWCALAIAGTVVATASAVTIAAGSGGAGTALAFWIVGKAISTAGVVGSCTDID